MTGEWVRTALRLSGIVFSAVACTRIAQVPPEEIPKLSHGAGRPVVVHLVHGGEVSIDPDFRFVRLLPQAGDGRKNVFHPPFRAELQGDLLSIRSRGSPAPVVYRLEEVTEFQVVQSDSSRSMPLLIGFLAGAAAGALILSSTTQECSPTSSGDADFDPCFGKGWAAIGGGLLGGAAGLLVAIPFTATRKYY